jgi:hypothetical protein
MSPDAHQSAATDCGAKLSMPVGLSFRRRIGEFQVFSVLRLGKDALVDLAPAMAVIWRIKAASRRIIEFLLSPLL